MATAAVGFSACAAPTPTPVFDSPVLGGISVDNGTDLPITLTVNGTHLAEVPPNTTQSPVSGELPARPWTVQALSPSGQVLASFTAGPNATVSDQASIGDVEFLPCGMLIVWAGEPMPDAPRPSNVLLKPCN